jgi:hypothetical protein
MIESSGVTGTAPGVVARRCSSLTPFTVVYPSMTNPADGDSTPSSVRGSGMSSDAPVPGAIKCIHPATRCGFGFHARAG